ncbi:flagellar brake protein [Paenibacillus sp. MMS18-CY102]|uniref:flagellar brake protein n=1 Tax=Paenibacillus sp. MMS18-CY102 TaxID=2682849 RepID=UPI00136675E3|nr:flagellar brake domain-containing protein [Paenibacillus sp. MMS18-CY102]MWC28441.1 glycosyl transferase [Paenibacillus sp. MMS18-CY102]
MLPNISQILHIQIASSVETAEEPKFEYKSRIADDREDNLFIELPLHEATGQYKKLLLGDELSVLFITENGVKHYFNTHVTGFEEEAIKLIRIQKPDPQSITRTQRRHYLRVAAELEVAVLTTNGDRFTTLTDDVGGGGISFICEGSWQLEQGYTIQCWLLLPYKNGTIEHASFKAEIVRANTLVTGRSHIMTKYVDMPDYERQKIIRYCFERQLEFRHK